MGDIRFLGRFVKGWRDASSMDIMAGVDVSWWRNSVAGCYSEATADAMVNREGCNAETVWSVRCEYDS